VYACIHYAGFVLLLVPASDGGLPVFAYVLFGVTGVVLLVALVIPIMVCCHRSCFHRRIKLVSPWKCSDPVEYVLRLRKQIYIYPIVLTC